MALASRPAFRLLLMLFGGLLAGLLTLLGQRYLPGQWNALVNSGAIWLAISFLLSTLFNTLPWAGVGGLLALASEVLGYFLSAWLFFDIPVPTTGLLVWLGVAVVGGPLSGIASYWWRRGKLWQRITGASFLSGVFVGEGSYYLLFLMSEKGIAGGVMIAVGVVLALILGRSWRERLYNLAALPVVVLLVLGVYGLLNRVNF